MKIANRPDIPDAEGRNQSKKIDTDKTYDELVAALEGLLKEFWTDRKRGSIEKDYSKLVAEEAAKLALAKAKSS